MAFILEYEHGIEARTRNVAAVRYIVRESDAPRWLDFLGLDDTVVLTMRREAITSIEPVACAAVAAPEETGQTGEADVSGESGEDVRDDAPDSGLAAAPAAAPAQGDQSSTYGYTPAAPAFGDPARAQQAPRPDHPAWPPAYAQAGYPAGPIEAAMRRERPGSAGDPRNVGVDVDGLFAPHPNQAAVPQQHQHPQQRPTVGA